MTRHSPVPLVPSVPASSGACCSRRGFLRSSLGCGAYAMLALAGSSAATRRAFAGDPEGRRVEAEESFARVEKLADGVWAAVSTPLGGDRTTVSNGGIVAGRDATLVVEGFNSPAGAAWLGALAKHLTGRAPTHVVLTHYHPDHSNGLAGYLGGEGAASPPAIVATGKTRDLLLTRRTALAEPEDGSAFARSGVNLLVPDTIMVDGVERARIDLGGRAVSLVARGGHTDSDLTVEVEGDERIVFTGDLVFNGLFPFFGDATPSRLAESCRAFISADYASTLVPGHGPVSDPAGLATYLELLDHVGAAARDFHAQGVPASEAWRRYEIPASLGEWTSFRPDIYRYAFEAWERELGAPRG